MAKPEVRYDDQSVRMGSVDFFADFGEGYINLGALNDAKLVVSRKIKKMHWSNREMPPRTRITEAKFSAKLFQIKFDLLSQIDGLGEVIKTTGTQQTVTDESYGEVGTALVPIKLNNRNGDGKAVTVTGVKAGGTAVTPTNYNVYSQGGESFLVFKTAQTGEIQISYTYTPNTSKKIVYKNIMKSQKLSKFKFVNTNEYGKDLTIEFPKGYQSGEAMELNFLNDDESEEGIGVDVEITAFPLVDGTVINIIDEQDSE